PLVLPPLRSSVRGNLRKHGETYKPGTSTPPARIHGKRKYLAGGRAILQPRIAVAAKANAFLAPCGGTKLGIGGRCRGLGRSHHRRGALLCAAVRRIVGGISDRE